MFNCVLTKDLEEQALEELNETQDKREEVLKHIIDWIHKEPHINFRTDRLWLLNFIRGAKFSTQKAKQKIEGYLTAKALIPEVFDNYDPILPELQQLFTNGFILPFHTPKMNCVLVRWAVLNPNENLFDVTKAALMTFEVLLSESESIIICGNYIIIDMKNFPFKFLKQTMPTTMKRLLENLHLAYPSRVKLLACINCGNGIESIFNIVKPFLPNKILKRIVFYDENYKELYNTIPQKYFPIEYGGSNQSIPELIKFWKNKVENCRPWFMENKKYIFDESRRLSILKDANSMYGSEGSFRSLQID